MNFDTLIKDIEWQSILDVIQPGGKNWKKYNNTKNGGCLDSCPSMKSCDTSGPDDKICSKKWRLSKVSSETIEVLFHIYNNFDHYNQKDLPSHNKDSEIVKKLRLFLFEKSKYFEKDDNLDTDEVGLGKEDLTKLRLHKRYDRNQKLALDAKKHHGYKCQACKFDFVEMYGEIGKEFIEAHHLIKFSSLKGKVTKLDPKTDFAVLCSNCHKMIHRSEYADDINKFRACYIKIANK